MRWLLSHFMLLIWGCELAIGPQGPQPARQPARQLTGWTTWKQHTELHKEFSPNLPTPPTPSTGGQQLKGGVRCGVGGGVSRRLKQPLVGCFWDQFNSEFLNEQNINNICHYSFISLHINCISDAVQTDKAKSEYHTFILPCADRKHLNRGQSFIGKDYDCHFILIPILPVTTASNWC